jgi:hypothetical protein
MPLQAALKEFGDHSRDESHGRRAPQASASADEEAYRPLAVSQCAELFSACRGRSLEKAVRRDPMANWPTSPGPFAAMMGPLSRLRTSRRGSYASRVSRCAHLARDLRCTGRSMPNRPQKSRRSSCNVPTKNRIAPDSRECYRYRQARGGIRGVSVNGNTWMNRSCDGRNSWTAHSDAPEPISVLTYHQEVSPYGKRRRSGWDPSGVQGSCCDNTPRARPRRDIVAMCCRRYLSVTLETLPHTLGQAAFTGGIPLI